MSMKRYLIAGGVGSMVFAAALGSAAALDINDPGVVQYGESMDLTCDADGVYVEGYTSDTEMTNGPAISDRVRVSGIDGACFGKTIVAVITNENGVKLARGTAEITTSRQFVNFDKPVNAGDIDGVRLLIG
jgi:hypothetical protein